MMETTRCTIVNIGRYVCLSYYCKDNRLRYSTGVEKIKAESKSGEKRINKIKDVADGYILEYTNQDKDIYEKELRTFLDKTFNPERIEKANQKAKEAAFRSLVDDHKNWIAGMREGLILKKKTKTRFSKMSVNQYERMRNRWEECAADPLSGFVLSYDMTITHFRNLVNWMIRMDYSQNSMYNIVNNLSIFLKYAYGEGYHSNKIFEHEEFSVPQEDADAISPKYNELIVFYNTPLKRKSDELARDLFVFGCFLALRVEDLSRINEYKLCGDHFELLTEKTSKRVVIPCHWLAKEIYEKYNGKMPVYIRQTLARILYRICKESGAFPGEKLMTMTIGGQKREFRYNRYELITPHTMRRFFATWMYRDLRRQPREIMLITGHETEESFFKYIKIELEDNAQEILNLPEFKKPS